MAQEGGMKAVMGWVTGIAGIALVLLIMLILFGNLSGNVGFASGTAGYNNTQSLIGNYTSSATNVSSQFPVVGTIAGVAILLFILIALLVFALRKMNGGVLGGGKGSSFA